MEGMQGMTHIMTFHLGSTEILSLGLGTPGPEGLQNSNIQNTLGAGSLWEGDPWSTMAMD